MRMVLLEGMSFKTVPVNLIEVQDRTGRWYSLRVRPYKTAEKKIDGAVLVLIEITHLKKQP